MTQHQFEKALKDYNKACQLKTLGSSSIFNKNICQSLICLDKKEFNAAISYLTKAEVRFSKNKECQFYKCCAYIQMYLRYSNISNTNTTVANSLSCVSGNTLYTVTTESKKRLIDARAILDNAVQNNPKEHYFYYYRALLLLSQSEFFDALSDLDKVTVLLCFFYVVFFIGLFYVCFFIGFFRRFLIMRIRLRIIICREEGVMLA
jgi:tetratricopeptide (TPR) repeat protein